MYYVLLIAMIWIMHWDDIDLCIVMIWIMHCDDMDYALWWYGLCPKAWWIIHEDILSHALKLVSQCKVSDYKRIKDILVDKVDIVYWMNGVLGWYIMMLKEKHGMLNIHSEREWLTCTDAWFIQEEKKDRTCGTCGLQDMIFGK